MTKVCSRCKIELDLSYFGKDKSTKDGLRYYCKDCNNSQYREWYASNDGKQVAADYRKNNPEQREQSRLKWQYKNQENANLKKYGLTKSEYNQMLNNQHGTCYICNRPPTSRKLHVDHDHKTQKIRALLCHGCNTSLGAVNEDITILINMIEYLKEFNDG